MLRLHWTAGGREHASSHPLLRPVFPKTANVARGGGHAIHPSVADFRFGSMSESAGSPTTPGKYPIGADSPTKLRLLFEMRSEAARRETGRNLL